MTRSSRASGERSQERARRKLSDNSISGENSHFQNVPTSTPTAAFNESTIDAFTPAHVRGHRKRKRTFSDVSSLMAPTRKRKKSPCHQECLSSVSVHRAPSHQSKLNEEQRAPLEVFFPPANDSPPSLLLSSRRGVHSLRQRQTVTFRSSLGARAASDAEKSRLLQLTFQDQSIGLITAEYLKPSETRCVIHVLELKNYPVSSAFSLINECFHSSTINSSILKSR